ncbi:MAG TPA: ATP-binding protein, partial [Candidatus Aquicultoraceae bacterium]|nr:ATP-binding protein [Candidatus Aquicultoraceae bacterium]
DGAVAFRNRVQEELFGEVPQDAGVLGAFSVHPEDAGKLGELIEETVSGKALSSSVTFRTRLSRGGDGKMFRWIHCQGIPIHFEGFRAHMLISIDITRLKELEQIVLVQEKMSTLGIIAAGIAHEIRNPLSGMNIYLSALSHFCDRSEDLDPGAREKIRAIAEQLIRASDKISVVIRGVMDFARPASLVLAPLDLNGTVEEAIQLCASTIRLQKVALETTLSPNLPSCPGDRMLLGQVLVNLITNALQAMEGVDGTMRLKIATALENGEVRIRVSDSGGGVPPELRHRIFDPFFTTRNKGYGIGLSFCRRVIDDHRGAISVHVSEWGGAEFRIALPAAGEGESP